MSERWMILKPSSFFGRRSSLISTRSSERLFASSIAYFATREMSPASFLSGVSDVASKLNRSARLALLVPRLRIYLIKYYTDVRRGLQETEKQERLWAA